MVGLIVKTLVGVLLFVGSLVGGLAATGRLTHEGTANIPVLSSFFPAPPPAEVGKDGKDGKGDPAKDGKAHAAEGSHDQASGAAPTDAHGAPAGETGKPSAQDAAHGDQPQEPQGPAEKRVGKSVVNPEKPADTSGGHGAPAGGHGEKPDAHGETKEPHGETKGSDAATGDHGSEPAVPGDANGHAGTRAPENDFQNLSNNLANGNSQYRPGALFRFDGMPAGLTAEQINEAWQRVQGLVAEIERRGMALDLREKELRVQQDDVGKRQADLGQLQAKLDEMQRAIDAKIQKFQDQVKLVRNDEVAALKRNAATLAAFEPVRAAEIVQDQWKTEKGQDEVLRLMEFMDKDAVNEILKTLPTPMAQDVMNKRLRVSKEPAATGKSK